MDFYLTCIILFDYAIALPCECGKPLTVRAMCQIKAAN